MSHVFCFSGEAFDFMLPLPVLKLIMQYILFCFFLLFVDCMMSLGEHVSVVESRFLTLLMLCFSVSVTNHELSKFLSCILMYLVVIVDPWAPALDA